MTTKSNITYQHFVWQRVHSEIKTKCSEIRTAFLTEKEQNESISRVDFIHRQVLNGTIQSIQCVPQAEIVGVLQYLEMEEDVDYTGCCLVFDAICNLWRYIDETEVLNFSKLSNTDQLDYFQNIKSDFFNWYSKENTSNSRDQGILMNAIHLPLLHRMSGHSTLEIIICYLLC